MRARRAYIDGTFGQVHLIEAPAPDTDKPLLVCLHATAYSVESLRPLVEAFDGDRHVVALDTPGYGGSDGPTTPIALVDYADALADALARLSPGRPVDIFGYHTGVNIAVEAALRHPGCIGRMAMIGIPMFEGPDFEDWKRRLVVRHQLEPDLGQFDERWSYLVTNRPQGVSLQRGFQNFVDELRAWPNGWWAHAALFEHGLADALAALDLPVLVINPTSALADISRRAAAILPQATLVERPDMSGAVFERYPTEIAALMRHFFDHPSRNRLAHHGEGPGAEIAQARSARTDHADAASFDDDLGSGAKSPSAANHG